VRRYIIKREHINAEARLLEEEKRTRRSVSSKGGVYTEEKLKKEKVIER
jgi:hypothetical protein